MAETKKSLVTRINKMEMKGFKSFANPINVEFGGQFNCVLGPNGSGKSNILDSLCFVLGKAGAKGLRADKTANLIYNGGKSKKASSTGEVHIYFDNKSKIFPKDTEEVKISRVVKLNGSSVYKINDETVTRQQITDMLGIAHINPDGYNIILQGDIVRLVEMSPNERRMIIEEISGISIYEDKKGKAERELGRVEQQLKEADIVLAERGTYLKELKKERDQALKFKELDEKIKRNKATVVVRKKTDRESKIKDLETKMSADQKKVDPIQNSIDSLKEQIIAKKKAIDDVSREVEEKGEKEQVE
ncbi:MAG: AAA family ATPase, partial [Candidatus Thorarchaeota archaeon]